MSYTKRLRVQARKLLETASHLRATGSFQFADKLEKKAVEYLDEAGGIEAGDKAE